MKNTRFARVIFTNLLMIPAFVQFMAAAPPQPGAAANPPAAPVKVEAALPELGAYLPDAITRSTGEPMRCLTAEAHFDPCVVQTLGGVRYVLGWDQATFQLVYLFTDAPAFRTQNNLAPGGQVRVVRSRLLSFKHWQVDPRLVSAGWFPVVVPLDQPAIVGQQDETNALVVGFVRAVYLNERVLAR